MSKRTRKANSQQQIHEEISKQPILELSYPITAQKFVKIKNQLNSYSDRGEATVYLDSLLAAVETQLGNKQQIIYIHQMALACIRILSDTSQCNKAITRFLSFSLFKESYFCSLVQHGLLHGKDSALSAKIPNLEQVKALMSVDKRCRESPSSVCVYLVNLLRILIGLRLHSSSYRVCDALETTNGLLFWINRLNGANKQVFPSLSDHTFRILYALIFAPSTDSNLISRQDLAHCLYFYRNSSKFQESTFDKLLAQCFKYLKNQLVLKDFDIVNFFQSNALESERTPKYRKTMFLWLDPLLNCHLEDVHLSVIFCYICVVLGPNVTYFTDLMNVFKVATLGQLSENFNFSCADLLLDSELQPLYCCMTSALNKRVFRRIDPLFQEQLTRPALSQPLEGCPADCLSGMYRDLIGHLSCFVGDELYSTTLDSSVIILSEIMFIQNQPDSALFCLWTDVSPPSSALAGRLASLSYNIGASLVGESIRALKFFEASIRFYHLSSSNSNHSDYRKVLKSWQGLCQCLYQLSRYEDCQAGVVDSMLLLLRAPELESGKLVESIITFYVSSGQFLEPYIPLCQKVKTNNTDIIDLELGALAHLSNCNTHQAYVLDYALSLPDLTLTSKCQYLLRQSEMDSTLCESNCKQVQSFLSSLSIQSKECLDKLQYYYLLSQSHIILGITLIQSNFDEWLSAIFRIWSDSLQFRAASERPPSSADQRLLEKIYCSSSQLFDFCFENCKYKYSLRVHSFCVRFCMLRTDHHMANDLVGQYVKAASLFIDLGHSGNAGDSLNSAKHYLSQANEKTKFRFYYCYADYLLTIGNHRKAQEIRTKLNEDPFYPEAIDILGAKIDFSTGCFKLAQEKSTTSYRSLMKKLKLGSSISPFLLCQCYKALLLLCSILVVQGLPLHLEYYFNQGLALGAKLGSKAYIAILSIEFARFLKMKRCLVSSENQIDSTTKQFGKELEEFAYFSAYLLQCRGELFLSMGKFDAAEKSFVQAASTVDSELDDPADGLSEAFQKGLMIADNKCDKKSATALVKNSVPPSLNLRSVALEIFKGRLSSLLASIFFRSGKLKESEYNFTLAKSLPLTLQESCIYHTELAKVRANQFFAGYAKVDQGVFSESVTSLQSNWTRTGAKGRSGPTFKRVEQLEILLKEAFSLVCRYGIPDEALQLAFSICKLYMFKANVMGEFEGHSLFHIAHKALEYPKCIFRHRRSGSNVEEVGNKDSEGALDSASDIDMKTLESANCIIVSVNVDVSSESLYISRLDSSSFKTLFKLPMRRIAIRNGCVDGPGLSFEDAMSHFSRIMIDNKETTTGAKFCTTPAQKKEWLQKRMKLDKELKEFLESIEDEWLAGFKGLLSNKSFANCQQQLLKFQSKLEKLISSFTNRCVKSKGKATSVIDLGFCEMILRSFGPNPQFDDLEDVLYFILDNYQMQGIAVEYDEISIEDMRDDLKAIVEHFFKESTCKSKTGSDQNEQHLVLILDKNVQHLPFESLPILKGRPVSRLPNIAMVQQCLSRSREIQIDSHRSVFYLLNPSGDLTKTEKKLSEPLSRWNGIRGRAPLPGEFCKDLENANLFLYFGHGGGESYIDCKDIPKLSKVPVLLLFGCSSGYLKDYGEFDSLGIAREYLDAGSQSVLGNLWDVTDVDIDKFSLSLMDKTGLLLTSPKLEVQDLVSAANSSRDACNLKFIVGAAPVVYGLPVRFLRLSEK